MEGKRGGGKRARVGRRGSHGGLLWWKMVLSEGCGENLKDKGGQGFVHVPRGESGVTAARW